MESRFEVLSLREREVLSAVYEGCRTRNEVAEKVGLSAPHLSRIFKKLKSARLITLENGVASPLFKGELHAIFYDVFSRYEKLFESIDLNRYILDDIPENLLHRMYELSNVITIESSREIFQPHPTVVDNMVKSEYVVGYGRMFYPEYAQLFLKLARDGVMTEAIINEKTLDEIRELYSSELDEYLRCPRSKLLVSRRNFNFSIILTDSAFFMSLFFKNGTLDYTKFYAWYDEDGRRWGRDLVEFLKKQSYRVESV